MRAGVVGARMAAAIAEGVELLHIADGEPGLGPDPGAQADLEGAMRGRVERTERQPRAGGALAPSPATRMAGSSPSTVTIAAVSPISIGVSAASVIGGSVASNSQCHAAKAGIQ